MSIGCPFSHVEGYLHSIRSLTGNSIDTNSINVIADYAVMHWVGSFTCTSRVAMSNNVGISLVFSVRFMTSLRHYICSIPVISFIILSLKDKPCSIFLIIIKRGVLFYVIEDIIGGLWIVRFFSTSPRIGRMRMSFSCITSLIKRLIRSVCPILASILG